MGLKKRLLPIILILVAFTCAVNIHAAGCGSTSCASPVSIDTSATCSPSDVSGYYYSFYLDSKQEVEISLSSEPEYKVRLGLGKESECSQLTGNWAKWGGWDGTLDSGSWVVLVEPNEAVGSFTGIGSFTLSIDVEESPDEPTPPSTYCGDDNCDSGESCSSCSSDCGSCAVPEPTVKKSNGKSCSLNSDCESGNCQNNICCQNSRMCCDDDNDCVSSIGSGYWCREEDNICMNPLPTTTESGNVICGPERAICVTGAKCINGDCVLEEEEEKYEDNSLTEGVKNIKCYAEDKTDGAIGEIGTYPNCAFDDTSGGNNKIDGIWEGSYTLSGNKLCLKVSNLRAPAEPMHLLGIGFTVTLSGITYTDGSTKKNIIVKDYIGNPGGIDTEKCLSIISKDTKKSTGDVDFCYECSSGSDCKSGVCKLFGGKDNRCTTNDPDVWCCYDKHHIIGYKDKVDCCVDSVCDNGYVCENYKCVEKESQTVKKSDGELCYSNDECESGNCNKAGITNEIKSLELLGGGTCCFSGKNCCDKIGSITGSSRGKELCAEDYTLVPIEEEVEKEVIPPIEWLAPWVYSVTPEGDLEGEKIKYLIHNEIYPFIVHKFGFFRSDEFGRRNTNPQINLVMTSEVSEASWDEKTATLTVPYADKYEQTGNYKKQVMQLNAVAHELIHYHFNGLALKTNGGKYTKVPIWFREALAEYGAHLYYKHQFSGKDGNPVMSVSEFREDRFGAYLEDKNYNYKETWEENGIKKASWKSYDDFDTDLEGYDHIYYGAVFSFVKFFTETYSNDEEMSDLLGHIFAESSRVDFKFYKEFGGSDFYDEELLKSDWIKTFEKEYSVDKLDNEPTNFFYKVKKFFGGLFG